MRIALQRLLSKPSALNLLRRIFDTPGLEFQKLSTTCRGCLASQLYLRRQATHAAVAIATAECPQQNWTGQGDSRTLDRITPDTSMLDYEARTGRKRSHRGARLMGPFGRWNEALWTPDELEFESNLDDPEGDGKRLLDLPEHHDDLKLWACLFEYRKRRYGSKGVRTFWKAMYVRSDLLPVEGQTASQFWVAFVELALGDDVVLNELCAYVQNLEAATGLQWRKLYVTIIQHLLCTDRSSEAMMWHDRLYTKFPPTYALFAQMCRYVIMRDGDLVTLQELYRKSLACKIYAKVIKALCEAQKYESAYRWHFACLEKDDIPESIKDMQPLLDFLRTYQPRRLEVIKRSFMDKNISLAAELEDGGSQTQAPSSTTHQQLPTEKVSAFNDGLGARWCATNWIALDTTFKAMHALGIDQIGPLTLQSIALREPDCQSIAYRINQLSELKISLGSSRFSRALQFLAANQQSDVLRSLLQSDQHPEEYDNLRLQEQLLLYYARTKDVGQYYKTLAILLLDKSSPKVHRLNLELMCHLHNGEHHAVMARLFEMLAQQIHVLPWITHQIIRITLRPRQPGRRPIALRKSAPDDLAQTISILSRIMRSGSFVPVLHWREIIRRLGMLGRIKELDNLLMFLVTYYGPNPAHRYPSLRLHKKFAIPPQISAAHPNHPLKILVPVLLQKAIITWSFQHALFRESGRRYPTQRVFPFTYGIAILRRLHERGVDIDSAAIRSALFDRLLVLYGSSRYISNKRINRVGRRNNTFTLEETVSRLDHVMGQKYFGDMDLRKALQQHSRWRYRRNRHVWERRLMNRPELGWYRAPRMFDYSHQVH